MKFIPYLKYWYFIGNNWSYSLAFFSIFYELRGEKKYHLNTIGIDRLKSISIKGENLHHSSIYQGCNYYILEKGFEYLKSINANENLTDFGCGKGRAMAVAAYYGFHKITGIDFAKALCNAAEFNLQTNKIFYPLAEFNIINEDVVNYQIGKEQNVFFFFNPFDEVVMLMVTRNILSSLKENPRTIYIMYANPVHKDIFLSAGFEEVYYLKKLEYLELSILCKAPDPEDT